MTHEDYNWSRYTEKQKRELTELQEKTIREIEKCRIEHIRGKVAEEDREEEGNVWNPQLIERFT